MLLTGILLSIVTYQVWVTIAESTIYLTTENITRVKTYDYVSLRRGNIVQEEPRIAYFSKSDNIALVLTGYYSPPGNSLRNLKESDDYLVFVETKKVSGLGTRHLYPKRRFEDNSRFTFYRIHKKLLKDKTYDVRTEFLGSIDTNLYGAWNGNTKQISISPDGKYIIMNAHAVNSRSHGEFRNKEVLLVWEIGDNVVEKDIVDSTGKKIPIIIKTEEELNNE